MVNRSINQLHYTGWLSSNIFHSRLHLSVTWGAAFAAATIVKAAMPNKKAATKIFFINKV